MDVVRVKGVKTCSNGNDFFSTSGLPTECRESVLEERFLGDACGKHGQLVRLDRFLCLIWTFPKLPDKISCFHSLIKPRVYKRRPLLLATEIASHINTLACSLLQLPG